MVAVHTSVKGPTIDTDFHFLTWTVPSLVVMLSHHVSLINSDYHEKQNCKEKTEKEVWFLELAL